MPETTTQARPPEYGGANGSAKLEPPKSPFFAWWCDMLDIHDDIDSRWAARDVADIAFAAGYNHAMKPNNMLSVSGEQKGTDAKR